jgi:DNA-binding transcriptional LysR family regulator
MRRLDTRSLEMFAAVADCMNFRLAAERLHVTQPPLTRAIQRLEARLGTRLFERDTQGVALTAAGKRLLPKAREILRLLDQAEHSIAAPRPEKTGQSAFRLGLTTSVEAGTFRPLIAALEQVVQLRLTYGASPRLVASLRAGRLDAALIALPTQTFELAISELARQEIVVALPSKHPLARRRQVSLHELASDNMFWFARARQPAFFDHCHRVFTQHGFNPSFVPEPDDHHVLLADIAAGKGIALLPASFAALKLTGVSYRKLQEGSTLAIGLGLAFNQGAQLPPLLLAGAELG